MKYLLTYNQLLEGKDEEKTLQKINKFFKCEYVTKKAVELNPKLAIWIVNTFKQEILKDNEDIKNELLEYFKTGKGWDKYSIVIMEAWKDMSPEYQSILDWAHSFDISNEDRTNLTKMSFDEAFKKSDEWHKSLKSGGVIEDEHGKILMTFPDGFYWIDLETTYDRDEANAMGHCGRTNKGDTIYSLRDRNKQPHITAAIDTYKGIVYQMKGRNNKKPIEKYHKYIVALLTNDELDPTLKGFGTEYNKKEDFMPEDLDKELFNILKEKRPEIDTPVYSDEEIEDMFDRYLDSYYLDDSEYGFVAINWMYNLYGGSGGTGFQKVVDCIQKDDKRLFDILCKEYPNKAVSNLSEYKLKNLYLHELAISIMADDVADKYGVTLPNRKDSNSNKWDYIYKELGQEKIEKIAKENDINILDEKGFENQFRFWGGYHNQKEMWYYDEIFNHFFGYDDEKAYKALEKIFEPYNDTYCKETWDVFNSSDVGYDIKLKMTVAEMEDEMSLNQYYEITGEY